VLSHLTAPNNNNNKFIAILVATMYVNTICTMVEMHKGQHGNNKEDLEISQ